MWRGQPAASVAGSVRGYPLKHGHLVVCIKYPERNPGFKNFNGFKMRAFNESFELQVMKGRKMAVPDHNLAGFNIVMGLTGPVNKGP